ncbi:MAG: DNA polymerase III subunit chi [Acidovorax sp.]|uniref:DNA polymerase III subunit chi n=1 Tax=Acidovorax sp. TaxID=1872122 RepID=UPI0025BB842A|nr:DNA polymerase III subunit chi [Acidovorax sp.]MCE1192130.1 DNA polymerase III subunit chi [Acidovorax sp.]
MTEVAFHFNAPDKLAYACRFARKVQRSGSRLVIAAPPQALAALDRMLWNLGPQDFVAHCTQDADESLLRVSPVVLAVEPAAAPHQDVLLNLHAEVPQGFERFERVVEVVSAQDEADRSGARVRWRFYASQGYAIVRHDLVLKAG